MIQKLLYTTQIKSRKIMKENFTSAHLLGIDEKCSGVRNDFFASFVVCYLYTDILIFVSCKFRVILGRKNHKKILIHTAPRHRGKHEIFLPATFEFRK